MAIIDPQTIAKKTNSKKDHNAILCNFDIAWKRKKILINCMYIEITLPTGTVVIIDDRL
jgi:hypothetical protein